MCSTCQFSSAATTAEKPDYSSFHDRERREISQLFDKNRGAIYGTWMQRKLLTEFCECDNIEVELLYGRGWVGVRVGLDVRVNYFRDSFSVLLRTQHYSMLTTFGSVSTALNNLHIINNTKTTVI